MEFANIVLLTTSICCKSAGAACQVGGVGGAAGHSVLKLLPPFVLIRVAPGWWPALQDVHVLLVCPTFTLKPWDQQYLVLSQGGLTVTQWVGRMRSWVGWPGSAGVPGVGVWLVIIVARVL